MESEKPAFTPGPWIAKWSKYRDGVFIVQAGMPSNRVLASFDGDGDGPDAQSLADARLIAAAPDMFEALTIMLDRYVGLVNSGDAGFWNPEEEDEVKTARAALSKALGKDAP